MELSLFKKIVYTFSACCSFIIGYMLFPIVSQQVTNFVKSSEDFALTKSIVQEVSKELFSAPLRGRDTTIEGRLSSQGVITFTNVERAKEGLPPLTKNDELTKAAEKKLEDMFNQQYFEHISPQGNGPAYLAEQAHYSYIIVGENLALGNFEDDEDLVAAWMASPGHKANIMHTRFSEIGVAVREGMFNGKKTWLAVQEFGTPTSSCPIIDVLLKERIDRDKVVIEQLSDDIEQLRATINSMPRTTQEEQREYNKKIREYNDLVVEYEKIATRMERLIEDYNEQVRAYNSCIKGN